jgi:ubiquinone/menaquinone biosynthesis C-methylase UbiE
MSRLIASSPPGWAVVGVDFNPAYVAYARDRANSERLANLSFEKGDSHALRFADASFDFIWSRFVLYFLPRPEEAIREFRRLLRPGGEVVVALHDFPNIIDHPKMPTCEIAEHAPFHRFGTPISLKDCRRCCPTAAFAKFPSK